MEPGYDVPASIGMAEADVQTPALIVDLDAFDHNLKVMRGIAAASGLRLRVHSKTHKSADIALAQMSRGGAVGICCQKVSEAEAMVRAGLHAGPHKGLCDIMVSNQVRGAARVARLARLAGQADMSVCVDDVEGVAELSRACHSAGTQLTVLVEIEVGQKRCGVQPHDAVRLAGAILAAPNLHFGGLQAYNGAAQHQTLETERAEMMGNVTAAVREALAALAAAGIHCPCVTGAGSGSYPAEASSGLYTELQCGSYIFMDADYRARGGPGVEPFRHALFVLSEVMSTAVPGRATCDAGLKSMSMESGVPTVWGRTDVSYDQPSDEHGGLADPLNMLRVGDQLRLVPGHCDPTCNLHDWYVGIRDGRVECLWPVTARGKLW